MLSERDDIEDMGESAPLLGGGGYATASDGEGSDSSSLTGTSDGDWTSSSSSSEDAEQSGIRQRKIAGHDDAHARKLRESG